MRLYLINPSNPLVSIVKVKESRWNRYRVWKPLSLMVLAGLTPPEWEITIVDENRRVPNYQAMPRPDLVGITAFTSQANRAYEVASHFRNLGVPVVMGGIHATMCLEEVIERVDSVVTGEAEGIWSQVLDDARNGSLKRRYDGGFAEINDVPLARHDLLARGYAFGAIQTTRGCPLNCSFCSVTAFNGARYRQRPIPDVVREFQSIREKRVLVVDDNLIGTRPEHIARAKLRTCSVLWHKRICERNGLLRPPLTSPMTKNFWYWQQRQGAEASSSALSPPRWKGFGSSARNSTFSKAGISAPQQHSGSGFVYHRFGHRRSGHRQTYRRGGPSVRCGQS